MNILTAENAIVTRLKAVITGVTAPSIQAFPNNPQDFFKRLHGNGAILVRFASSTYTEPLRNRQKVILQDRTGRWLITIVHRNLSPTTGHTGLYTFLTSVRQALTGYTVTNQADSSMMYPVRDGYAGYEEGKWFYEIEFEHTWPEDNTT
jgi:hypothetical protein